MSRLPHKEPLIYAKKVLDSDENKALVELDFGETPSLAMHIEAAAQSFSFINRQEEGSWGVVAMIKNSSLVVKCQENKYLCEVSITQSIYPYYKIYFKNSSNNVVIATGELSIKIF